MGTVTLLNGTQENTRMTLPLTEDVISSLAAAISSGMFKIVRAGLDFNFFDIMFRPSELAGFSESKLLKSGFKGRILLEVEGNRYEEERILSFIMSESMKRKEHLIEKILHHSSDSALERKETATGFYDRDQELASLLKEFYGHQCMICKDFILTEGIPYTESHHMILVSEGGPDDASNIAIMCPNCHAKAHHGCSKDKRRTWKIFNETNPFLKAS